MERTLSIIKPDATTRNLTGKINAMIEEAGLKIIAQKMTKLSPAQAEGFYAEHKGKSFFDNLRKTFALSIDKNSVHGSDSPESAAREISYFFSQIDIF